MGFLKYKGYSGTVEYSPDDNCLFGRVQGMAGITISYEGKTLDELRKDFEDGIESYLDDCAEDGITPQKPYSGKLNFRMTSQLHEKVAQVAYSMGCSINDCLNTLVAQGVEKYEMAHKKMLQ